MLARSSSARRAAVHPWTGRAIEALLLDAAAREQLGDRRAAEDVARARARARRARRASSCRSRSSPVRELLERHPRHRTAHATLLADDPRHARRRANPQRRRAAPLREPLSDAELRVLRYLPSNLKAPEIAAELCVSPNTVRTHLRHIYAKLDAHSRSEAVARARELGLLGARDAAR